MPRRAERNPGPAATVRPERASPHPKAGARGEHLPPGRERLLIVAEVYLDTFRARPGVRAFLFEARGEPAVRAEISERNRLSAEILAPEFEALGWKDPIRMARLWLAALAATGVVELELGRRDDRARQALAELVREAPRS